MVGNHSVHKFNAIFKSVIITFLVFFSVTVAANNLWDPTTPLHQASRSASHVDLVLSAIADVGGKRFAIVNDRRVYAGDTVNGALIERVNEASVVYSFKGKQYTIKMRLSLIE